MILWDQIKPLRECDGSYVWLSKNLSVIWNMASLCLIWIIRTVHNRHTFEDVESMGNKL